MLPWLVGAVALYAAAMGALYVAQDRLLFPRDVTRRGQLPLPVDAERQELLTAEGHRLVGYSLRRPGARHAVLLFTGNAWNAEDCLIFTAHRLTDVHLMVFHYRGYEPSEGAPSEDAFIQDALAQRDLAIRLFGGDMPSEAPQLFAIGYSIGTGVAAKLAGMGAIAGAVLVTPFDSIEAIARSRYFFAPVSWLLKHPFRSDLALSGVDVPVAVIAAGQDRVIPKARSEALVAGLVQPVMVETVNEAGHASLYDLPQFDNLLIEGLRRVTSMAGKANQPLSDR